MSAYGHQMEHMYSARSLSGGSEMRSNHVMESGFYITSFVAAIFITALTTIGILLVTLLIALAMLLQSCQNTNDGVIEIQNTKYDYNYCKFYSLHAALNSLEGHHNLPNICRNLAIEYIKGGQYAKDLDLAKSLIEDYFDKVRSKDDGLGVVLIDIDGFFPSNPYSFNLFQRFHDSSISNCVIDARNLKSVLVLSLCKNLQAAGWPVILLSRELETHRNVTVDRLILSGFGGWLSLMMRAEDKDSAKENEWFSRQRNMIQKKGFRIKGIISSHMDAMALADAGIRNFLLPDPICDKFEQQSNTIE